MFLIVENNRFFAISVDHQPHACFFRWTNYTKFGEALSLLQAYPVSETAVPGLTSQPYTLFFIWLHFVQLYGLLSPLLGLFSCLLVQYVAMRTTTQHEVELHLVKELHSKINLSTPASSPPGKSLIIDPGKDELRILGEGETLEGLATNNLVHGYLVITPRIFIYLRYANMN